MRKAIKKVTAYLFLGLIYITSMRVCDTSNNIVTMETATGYTYSFDVVEDWQVGDIATVMMHDNCTTDIADDVILHVTYSGFQIQ